MSALGTKPTCLSRGRISAPWKIADVAHGVFYAYPRPIAQPEILNAAIAAMLTRSESFADSDTICTDLSRPTRSGPITVAPPSSCNIFVEIEAEWNAGMIRTFAMFVSRLNG